MKTRVAFQPVLGLGVLVGGVVAGDQMKVEGLGRVAIDGPQKAHELLMTMARHAFADDLAGCDIERGKQRRRAVVACSRGSSCRRGPSSAAIPAACDRAAGFGSSASTDSISALSSGSR